MEKLVWMLKEHEGLRLEPYLCTAGKLTIGYGRNLQDRGISKQEAIYLLENDVAMVLADCEREFEFWDKLDPVRKAVLADMVFNMGIAGVKRFKKMLAAIQEKDWLEAGEQMKDSRWYLQVGRRSKTLKSMMVSGQWTK